jgi:ribosomal protein S18 acetylase RimI-like enzyme
MAAHVEWPEPRVVELRRISAEDLELVLAEEIAAWRRDLSWDLSASVELVRRYTRMQALNGFALLDGSRVVGYSYSVREDCKGLIGDHYILESHRTPSREEMLLRAVLSDLWSMPGLKRVEAQLLMLGGFQDRPLPFADLLSVHPRLFLEFPLQDASRMAATNAQGLRYVPWREAHFDDSAKLLSNAYRGNIDSEINDQYRSVGGARRFLSNIVEFPGCGTFFAPASWAVFDESTRELCGMCLASLVARETGHITQLCVEPSHRKAGLATDLLRHSLAAFALHGCRSVSLTVTQANENAVRLYRRLGFVERRRFSAHVWDLH